MLEGVFTFSSLYNLFLKFIDFISDIWETLNLKISELPEVNFDDGALSGLFEALVNSTLKSLQVVAEAFFGDITLLEFVLGASIATVVGCYVVKFVLSFTPLL